MSTRKLLILTAVFLALFAFVALYERKQPTSEERAAQAKRLLDFKADDVTRIADRAPRPPEGGAEERRRRPVARRGRPPEPGRRLLRRRAPRRPRPAGDGGRAALEVRSEGVRARRAAGQGDPHDEGRGAGDGLLREGDPGHGRDRRLGREADGGGEGGPARRSLEAAERVPQQAPLRDARGRHHANRAREGADAHRPRPRRLGGERGGRLVADREPRRRPGERTVRRAAPRGSRGGPDLGVSGGLGDGPRADLSRAALGPRDAAEGDRDRRDARLRRREGGRHREDLREGRRSRRRGGRPRSGGDRQGALGVSRDADSSDRRLPDTARAGRGGNHSRRGREGGRRVALRGPHGGRVGRGGSPRSPLACREPGLRREEGLRFPRHRRGAESPSARHGRGPRGGRRLAPDGEVLPGGAGRGAARRGGGGFGTPGRAPRWRRRSSRT